MLIYILAGYIRKSPRDMIQISPKQSSIPAHIIYLSQTANLTTPNSVTKLVTKPSIEHDSRSAQITATSPLSPTTYVFTSKNRQQKANQTNHRNNTNDTHETNTQTIYQEDHQTQLNVAPPSSSYSSSKEVNKVMLQLQNALSNYLVKQAPPDQSLEFMMTLTLDQQGKLEKIIFSPLPPEPLQKILQDFLQKQGYTKKLILRTKTQLKIPIQLNL